MPPQRSTCKAFKASEEIKIREWEKDSGGTRKWQGGSTTLVSTLRTWHHSNKICISKIIHRARYLATMATLYPKYLNHIKKAYSNKDGLLQKTISWTSHIMDSWVERSRYMDIYMPHRAWKAIVRSMKLSQKLSRASKGFWKEESSSGVIWEYFAWQK